MHQFDYFSPTTITEAQEILENKGSETKLLAGGTDLVLFMTEGHVKPPTIVNITGLEDLKGMQYDEATGLRIGPLTTMREIEQSPIVKDKYPALATSTLELAGVQIRNMATIGGNTCNASPAADTTPALMALDAVAVLIGPNGERKVSYTDFFTGPGQTVMQTNELLAAIELPPPPSNTGSHYIKLAVRRAMDIAIVGLGASVTLADGVVQDARITLGAVGPTVVRAIEAEEMLKGRTLKDSTLDQVAKVAVTAGNPIDDVRASAEYRKMMIEVLTKRAVQKAAQIAVN